MSYHSAYLKVRSNPGRQLRIYWEQMTSLVWNRILLLLLSTEQAI